MSTNNVVPFAARDRHTSTTEDPPAQVEASPVTSLQTAVYTVREVAYLLSLSLGSAYSLIRSGEIPARKMGARWVVPKQRFHTWLNDLPTASTDDLDHEFENLNDL